MPEWQERIEKAVAVFDAKKQLLAQGWDIERVRALTWVVDAHPAEPGDDRATTFTARFVEPRASSRSGLKSQMVDASNRDRFIVNPPPMPTDPQQYWASVTLRNGHTVTLSISVSPARLRGEDQTLFYDLVSRLRAH